MQYPLPPSERKGLFSSSDSYATDKVAAHALAKAVKTNKIHTAVTGIVC